MYIVMNRFKVIPGKEEVFLNIWRQRESHLDQMPGFVHFYLLQGAKKEEYTLFSSMTQWQSQADFLSWMHSDAFKKSHARAGGAPTDLYAGPNEIECFEAVL